MTQTRMGFTGPINPKSNLLFCGANLSDYTADGFRKVCRVDKCSTTDWWVYTETDQDILFKAHHSWVYMIVVDGKVFKIGETANRLGVRKYISDKQPIASSKSRIGRYIRGDGTDEDIRYYANEYIKANCNVEFWAKECEILKSPTIIAGEIELVESATQKSQELRYLRDHVSRYGRLPLWNKGLK